MSNIIKTKTINTTTSAAGTFNVSIPEAKVMWVSSTSYSSNYYSVPYIEGNYGLFKYSDHTPLSNANIIAVMKYIE